jgi:hypothetical protein
MGEGTKNSRQNEHRQGGPSRHPQRDAQHDSNQGNQEHTATNPKKPREYASSQATENGFDHIEIVMVPHIPYEALAM